MTEMTWQEFKEQLEAAGVTDMTRIGYIRVIWPESGILLRIELNAYNEAEPLLIAENIS